MRLAVYRVTLAGYGVQNGEHLPSTFLQLHTHAVYP
jgi:hypothetical protein